jgi:DNA-binding GntR family transcriptional regulator
MAPAAHQGQRRTENDLTTRSVEPIAGSAPQAEPDKAAPDAELTRQLGYRRFQHLLLNGDIQPGQNLSQRELKAKLDIALGALRELLPRLEAEGLLVVLPQRGIQITTVDLRMIRESYQMRLALEREAALHAVDHVSDEDLQRLRRRHTELIEQSRAGVTAKLLEKAQRTDSDFHDFLISATGNRLLIQTYSIIAIRVRMIQLDRIRLNAIVLAPSLSDHIDIIDAILKRDPALAMAAMDKHIRNARDRALSL